MQRDQEVINRWSGSAPYWKKHREVIRHMFAPVTEAIVEEGQIGSGQSVLDIATGPGEPALTLASLVGSQGNVCGVDPIPEMIAAARREASRLELRNVRFEVASADHLPFPANTFDAVVSRFGVMFFPSPLEAVREMLRALKPGQKLIFAVWNFAERNPFHCSLSRVVDRYVEPPPPEPDALDAFRFATPGKLRAILHEAAVTAPTERLHQFTIDVPMSVEDYWALRLEMSVKLREKISMLPKEQMAELTREVLESVREYSTDRGIRFPAEVLIVSGAKDPPSRSNRLSSPVALTGLASFSVVGHTELPPITLNPARLLDCESDQFQPKRQDYTLRMGTGLPNHFNPDFFADEACRDAEWPCKS